MDHELLTRYLRDQASPAERDAVAAWVRAAPENEEQLAELASLLGLVDADHARIVTRPPPRAARIIAAAEAQVAPRRRSRIPVILAAAAVVVVGIGIFSLRRTPSAPTFAAGDYRSTPTAATTVQLSDGSVVRLAPSSHLTALESSGNRTVRLEGQAFFAVAKVVNRPFEVRTAAGSVTVLGTRFDLAASSDSLSLVVVEGSVALAVRDQRATVTAGEMSAVRGGRLDPPTKATDLAARLAWTGNFLVFLEAPLADVAREIAERYRVKVEIADSVLARRTVTAWLSDRSLDQALTVVCTIVDADCRTTDTTVTMRSR